MAAVPGDALGALHRAGYLLGDGKPSNIGFAADGSPKPMDFGLARETNASDALGGSLPCIERSVI